MDREHWDGCVLQMINWFVMLWIIFAYQLLETNATGVFSRGGTPEPLVFQIDATIQLDDHLLEKHLRLADMSCLLAAHRFFAEPFLHEQKVRNFGPSIPHQKCTCCNLVLQHFHPFIDGFPLKYLSGKSKEKPKIRSSSSGKMHGLWHPPFFRGRHGANWWPMVGDPH